MIEPKHIYTELVSMKLVWVLKFDYFSLFLWLKNCIKPLIFGSIQKVMGVSPLSLDNEISLMGKMLPHPAVKC